MAGESHTQYKGPKDVDSMMFFINEMTGNGEESKKVNSIQNKVRMPQFRQMNFAI